MNRLQNNWYRQTTVFGINTKKVLSASLTDLTGSATFTTITPTDWYFMGGASSTFTPDANRLFAGGGEPAGNSVGWDNISLDGDSSVPEPATVVMAGAALAALALWRRR
jgi:MYXO-CTERM domain-containing protein